MDLTDRRNPFNNLVFPPPPPPPSTTFTSPIFPRASSSGTNFPIIAIAVIGILATAFLLVSYYIFVIKCCLNWHQIDIFRRRRRSDQNPLMIYSPHEQTRGLDESSIRAIPIFKFKKRDVPVGEEHQNKNSQECSVCLNEFEEDEKLRIIPNCCHVFHIDCIDIWLQGNANCPLCRTSVSCDASFPLDLISARSSSPESNSPLRPQSPSLGLDADTGDDKDFVVIELGTSNGNKRYHASDKDFLAEQERVLSDGVNTLKPISPSPRKFDNHAMQNKERKLHKVTSKGDECIDTRGEDDQFVPIQPIRRSISMDSSADRQLSLAVQEAISRRNGKIPVAGDGGDCTEDCSSSGGSSDGGNNRVMKRCFFSFGSSRGSKSSSILPVYLEP